MIVETLNILLLGGSQENSREFEALVTLLNSGVKHSRNKLAQTISPLKMSSWLAEAGLTVPQALPILPHLRNARRQVNYLRKRYQNDDLAFRIIGEVRCLTINQRKRECARMRHAGR